MTARISPPAFSCCCASKTGSGLAFLWLAVAEVQLRLRLGRLGRGLSGVWLGLRPALPPEASSCNCFASEAPLLLLVEDKGPGVGGRRYRIRRKRRHCCPLHCPRRRRGCAKTTMSSSLLRLLRFLGKRLGENSSSGCRKVSGVGGTVK
uniref:Uncharacterized protein n=1 Tax=Oryza glumipatula TaxID=40148 RepID=A0A0E0B0W7_9ORYZ